MKHSTRMILLPEDVYNAFSGDLQQKTNKSYTPITGEDLEISRGHESMFNEDSFNNKEQGGDYAKHIRYQQQFKRVKKLVDDKIDRPIRVTFDNPQVVPTPSQTSIAKPKRPKKVVKFRRKNLAESLSEREKGGNSDVSRQYFDETSQETDAWSTANEDAFPSYEEILSYVMENAEKLGVDYDGRIKNQSTGDALKTSKIDQIVQHALSMKGYNVSTPSSLQPAKAPTGFAIFIKNARNDPFLSRALYLFDYESAAAAGKNIYNRRRQRGKGIIKRIYKKSKSLNKTFYFKPQLW